MIGMQPFVTVTMLIMLAVILLKALKVIRHETFVICLQILATGYAVFFVAYIPTQPIEQQLAFLTWLSVMSFFYHVFNRR